MCVCSFEQLGLDAEMTATLASLYGSIDALEWPVGVVIEQATDGLDTFFGEVRSYREFPLMEPCVLSCSELPAQCALLAAGGTPGHARQCSSAHTPTLA